MKLAEALILRADAQKRFAEVLQRILANSKVQEGEKPSEEVADLFTQLDATLTQFNELIKRINRTNAATQFDEGRTLTDALADRDTIKMERAALDSIIIAGRANPQRLTRAEIKMVSLLDIPALQKRSDNLARQYRELDTTVQQLNWLIEVVE